MKILNAEGLAQEGFVLIRALLDKRIEGGESLALQVAEALHNIPVRENEFTEQMTVERVLELQVKHPEHKQLRNLMRWVEGELPIVREVAAAKKPAEVMQTEELMVVEPVTTDEKQSLLKRFAKFATRNL
ncbi:hypothetical protein [Pseudovibrio sp. Tun.PSC04-5.I4]|uniref:hypothetical protein n=1 Tax=Pseudovibrio sp. Tun.PSC04-5.I4 TaxID=1798213 RepID=UPI0008875A3B|nr:hypothetical protein [Pseudovibrio sp. Tun.PSC04-5.I4]SDR49006.1 hypothetical protein SAMN04515695_6104 [Pseudovibrio sp. Tun.PSC04-5.I4]